ncbi:MAG TPA: hypothetical protein ENI99_09555 [Sedimenticola sp.]|nr:hypothetical protein [Sedimenticola sp.]
MSKKSMLVRLAAVTLGLGLVSGCATTEQLNKLQADVTRAQETADAALAAANGANSAAADAQRQADAALSAANRAESTAASAERAASACSEKCSRMMEKGFAK